jgi:TfoX/Sxy family transcriptional regulator of competence genes
MAYDEGLAERLNEYFKNKNDIEVKKMFGGLCFMLKDHMCCGIVNDTLMARVGPDNYEKCLAQKYAKEMDFTGRALKGMVYVEPQGFEEDADLEFWMGICEQYVESLPAKKPKKRKNT